MQISSTSSKFKNGDRNNEDGSSLLKSEERYKNLVANIPGAVYRCTCEYTDDGELTRTTAFLSEAVQEISGYPSSDFINDRVRSLASIIHPQDRKNVDTTVKKSVATRTPYILEYRIVRADGEISWVTKKAKLFAARRTRLEEDKRDKGKLRAFCRLWFRRFRRFRRSQILCVGLFISTE